MRKPYYVATGENFSGYEFSSKRFATLKSAKKSFNARAKKLQPGECVALYYNGNCIDLVNEFNNIKRNCCKCK